MQVRRSDSDYYQSAHHSLVGSQARHLHDRRTVRAIEFQTKARALASLVRCRQTSILLNTMKFSHFATTGPRPCIPE